MATNGCAEVVTIKLTSREAASGGTLAGCTSKDRAGAEIGTSSPTGKLVDPGTEISMFQRWYRHLGFVGCSSHSGRRTFITNIARRISTVGGSLRDVQALAGHSNLRTTQRYIDENPDAHARVVELV